jgi:hypothetical protein
MREPLWWGLDAPAYREAMSRPMADEITPLPSPNPLIEECATCFYGRELWFNVPVSGHRALGSEDRNLLVCARQSPNLRSDPVLEARWPQVRPDHWCGDWSASGGPVGAPTRRVGPKQFTP